MTSSSTICYLNGAYLPLAEAALPLTDLSILRGYAVFDYLRTYRKGQPFRLDDHVRRLRSSADQIGLTIKESNETIADIVETVLAKNKKQEDKNDEDVEREVGEQGDDDDDSSNDDKEWAIRIIATGGVSDHHFLPTPGRNTLAVMVEPIDDNYRRAQITGVKVITIQCGSRTLPTVKSINYITSIVATQRAAQTGAVEALYVDDDGYVSEGTRSNIFFILGGGNEIVTAPDPALLQGVTRKVVIELIEQDSNHLTLTIRAITLDEVLTRATEAFLTSSTKEIVPVVAIDGHRIGNGERGPVTERCQRHFRDYARGSRWLAEDKRRQPEAATKR
jgi:branched-chain amino acid aminotransferase